MSERWWPGGQQVFTPTHAQRGGDFRLRYVNETHHWFWARARQFTGANGFNLGWKQCGGLMKDAGFPVTRSHFSFSGAGGRCWLGNNGGGESNGELGRNGLKYTERNYDEQKAWFDERMIWQQTSNLIVEFQLTKLGSTWTKKLRDVLKDLNRLATETCSIRPFLFWQHTSNVAVEFKNNRWKQKNISSKRIGRPKKAV